MGNNKLKSFRQFLTEEDGMGTVEVILIIVVLVGLVIILKRRSRKLSIPFSQRLQIRPKDIRKYVMTSVKR